MPTITLPRQKISSVYQLKQKQLLTISVGAVGLWMLVAGIFTPVGWGQNSIELPKSERPAVDQISPVQSPTADNLENLSGTGDPPPTYERNASRSFNLYRLDIGDGLSVNVPRFPEFSTVTNIDEEGKITVPILGKIALNGLTLAEVEQKISYELGKLFLQEQPDVFVALTAARPAQITVLGEVSRPGYYAFLSGSPLTIALQTAGGSTQEADLRSVIVRRPLVDGSVLEETVDLYTPLIKGETLPELRLQGGDTIIVPKLEVGEDRDYDRALVARTTLPQQTISVRVLVPVETGMAFRNLVLPNGSTFIDAIASLPPEDDLLIKEEVALMRFDQEKGDVVSQQLNTEAIINGDLVQNVPLQNNDVIIVSRTLIGKVFNVFNLITRPIRDVLSFISVFDFLTDN